MMIPSSHTAVPATLWPPAAYCDFQVLLAAKTHGSDDAGCSVASNDQSQVAVDGAIPYGSGGVVFGVVSCNGLSLEPVDLHGVHRTTVDVRP
jgi:hypothetical protein